MADIPEPPQGHPSVGPEYPAPQNPMSYGRKQLEQRRAKELGPKDFKEIDEYRKARDI